MHELLVELEELTHDLITEPELATMEQVEAYMELRERLVELTAQGLRELDVRLYSRRVKELLAKDPEIIAIMEALKHEATEGLNRLASNKKRKAAYEGSELQYDGVYFDKRK